MSSSTGVPPGTLRILIVDDETIVRDSLAAWFRQDGHKVDVAEGGKEALHLVSASRYDMAFLDIKMPGMDGLELQERLAAADPELSIVLMTAYASKELVNHGLQTGAAGVLEKPLDIQLLLDLFSMLKHLPLITIVDDDAAFCQTLSEILRLSGYPVKIISDPHQASDVITDQNQIILLDMKLNAIDGFALLQEIHQSHPAVPVLLVTSYRQEMAVSIQKALEIQARACLYKPLEIEKLLQTINEIQLAKMRKMLAGN